VNCRYKNLWLRPPALGDLVEMGYDATVEKPYIGVITQIESPSSNKRLFLRKKTFGCVLVNGVAKWCNIYDLKPADKKT